MKCAGQFLLYIFFSFVYAMQQLGKDVLIPTAKVWKKSDNRLKVKLNTASESQPRYYESLQ